MHIVEIVLAGYECNCGEIRDIPEKDNVVEAHKHAVKHAQENGRAELRDMRQSPFKTVKF